MNDYLQKVLLEQNKQKGVTFKKTIWKISSCFTDKGN